MYMILGLLAFVAWGLERYFKFFSRFAKGVKSGYVSAALLGVFLLFVIAEAVAGNWFRSVALIFIAGIAIWYWNKGDKATEEKRQ